MGKNETEKSPFSRPYQVGVVVKDMDKAIEFYQALGIGPFVEGPSVRAVDRRVYGKPADVIVKGSIAKMGQLEFELLQPVRGESIQKEFLDSKGEGVIHICFFVDDIDKEVAKLAEEGFKVISSAIVTGFSKFAYIDTREVGGVILELVQRGPF